MKIFDACVRGNGDFVVVYETGEAAPLFVLMTQGEGPREFPGSALYKRPCTGCWQIHDKHHCPTCGMPAFPYIHHYPPFPCEEEDQDGQG
jgi:hypothetical protein